MVAERVRITSQVEAKIVAMLARGDTYAKIRENMIADEGRSPAILTLSNIKKRNLDSIQIIKNKLTQIEVAKTEDLLMKTRHLIERKLDASLDESVPPKLQALYDDGVIDDKEFETRYQKVLNARNIALKDLTTVSKEMFNQSQIESGRPTSITNSPELAKQQLDTLLRAINTGKEEDIAKAIFIDD